ncbi:putative fungal pheromoneG-protein-coupled receptor [Amylocystis lapponica]|nr:putative fungal pheromoneG-protein-coupled receptor [Amylocystis lapponica]
MVVSWPAEQNAVIAMSFIGFVLASIPLYWHLEAWNVGCVMYIFWSGSQCLIQFINCIIWKNNAINWSPIWCDITSRWKLASGIGICTASLVINRRLYKIATVSTVSLSRADKRRMVWADLAIGLGIPAVQVGIYWFIQGHRFDIFEGYGCAYEIPNTIMSYFLEQSWPVVVGCVSAVYCFLTLRAFVKRRKQFNELMTSNSNLTYHRYLRLMGLAALEMCTTVPLGVYTIVHNAQYPLYKWRGYGDLHSNFSRVGQYPAVLWRMDPATVSSFDFDFWTVIICPLMFFAFFGLAEEARKHYYVAATTVAKRVGLSTSWLDRAGSSGFNTSKPTMRSVGRITIPTFVQQRNRRRDSLESFSDRLSSISIADETDLKMPYSPSAHSLARAHSSHLPPTPRIRQAVPRPPPAFTIHRTPCAYVPSSVPKHDADIV